jgi:hypothetical protein
MVFKSEELLMIVKVIRVGAVGGRGAKERGIDS